jgi:hypothetical protein
MYFYFYRSNSIITQKRGSNVVLLYVYIMCSISNKSINNYMMQFIILYFIKKLDAYIIIIIIFIKFLK